MTWKSINSSGWEYLIVWEDLGSSPMYAILCVIKLVLLLIYINYVMECYNKWIILVSMKYELAWWFGIDLALHGCGFKSWRAQTQLYFGYF